MGSTPKTKKFTAPLKQLEGMVSLICQEGVVKQAPLLQKRPGGLQWQFFSL